jgi:hypothetical protein
MAATTVTAAAPASAAPTLTLAYNGKLRDRVGQGDTSLGPDGALDGTRTATLSGRGGRTVTALQLDIDAPGTPCQRSPYSEPPGSGKLSHPGRPS